MSSSLDMCFIHSDLPGFYPVGGKKQPAKILFHNIQLHSWQPWAGFTGRRKLLFPCQSQNNAILHIFTSVQPAVGLSKRKHKRWDRGMDRWGKERLKNKSVCKKETLRVVSSHCQRLRSPNVLAIKLGENTHTHRQTDPVRQRNYLFLIVEESWVALTPHPASLHPSCLLTV